MPKIYSSKNFSLRVKQLSDKVLLTQQIHNSVVYTHQLPHVYGLLARALPSIMCNKCFNPGNLPFSQEVQKTEVGHLFEHLILEYYKLEYEKRIGHADVSGVTNWDWTKEPHGKFNIVINSSKKHQEIFSVALKKAIMTLEQIYENNVPEAGLARPRQS